MNDKRDDFFAREFLGRPATHRLEDVHPFPWTVRRHVSPDRITRSRYEVAWVVLDAHSKCVAECESQIAAEAIARCVPPATCEMPKAPR